MTFLWMLFLACGSPKQSINVSEKSDTVESKSDSSATLSKESQALEKCVAECVRQRQMEARAVEAITADCESSCKGERSLFPENAEPKE